MPLLTEPFAPNATQKFIEALAEKHDNAIPIFGGAIFLDGSNLESIALYLPAIIRNAEFFRWHDSLANACRQFCHCLFIDPMLMEAYIGSSFEDFVEAFLDLKLEM